MGASLQMPYAGYLNVEHRRLRAFRGVEHVAFKDSQFSHFSLWSYKSTVVGKADGSVVWHTGSTTGGVGNAVQTSGSFRWENPKDDEAFLWKERFCEQTASNDGGEGGIGLGFISYIEQIPVMLDDNTYGGDVVHSLCYVPTTNEMWFVASPNTPSFTGGYGLAVGHCHILRCDADSSPSTATLVLAEPVNYWYNFFSGTTAMEHTIVELRYDHVRDCVWAYYKVVYSTFENNSNQFDDIIHHGHLSLRKYSTSGVLLDEIMLQEWSNLYWRDNPNSDFGVIFEYGIQPWFVVGDDGLMWYTTTKAAEWPNTGTGYHSVDAPPTFGGGARDDLGNGVALLRSYNPDTGEYVSYPAHWFSAECPGIMENGELLLWQADKADSDTNGQWWAFDPATDTKVALLNPGWICTGQGFRFYRGCSTLFAEDGTRRIFAIEHHTGNLGMVLQFLPGAYGLTVESADWTRFDHPWETTSTPIYNTTFGEIHEATYGPFQKGDLIRLGCLLEEKASGQDKPAERDLCVASLLGYPDIIYGPTYVIDGEEQRALWDYDNNGTLVITWDHYDKQYAQGISLPSAETTVRLSIGEAIEEISPDIVDTTIRIVTLDEVVPIRYDQAAEVIPSVNGCPNDNAGLSWLSWPPVEYG